jgi:hypothetical protein
MKKHKVLITIEILLGFSMLAYASHPLGSDAFYATLREFILFRDPVTAGTTLQSSLTSGDGSTLVLDPTGRVECTVLHLNATTESDVEVLKSQLEVGDMIRWLPAGEIISTVQTKDRFGNMREMLLDRYPDQLREAVVYDWFIKLDDGDLYGFSRERQG